MSTTLPAQINENNLSIAWGKAFLATICRRGDSTAPLAVSIGGMTNGIPTEDDNIRQILDETLLKHGKPSIAITAMLIFPFKFWMLMGRPHIEDLSRLYLSEYLPRLKARDPHRNHRGTYFERMIAFQGSRIGNRGLKHVTTNQLQHIVSLWNRGLNKSRKSRPRRSALQVACFDPAKDHTGAALGGFPCLQQVSFAYDQHSGLAVNAYYPSQYIFDRAYGNYLGLCHLGYCMAREMGLQFERLNCFIGYPELGGTTKERLRDLECSVREIIPGD